MKSDKTDLLDLVDLLPDRQSTAVKMWWSDCDYKFIAETVNKKVKTVKKWIEKDLVEMETALSVGSNI